MNSLKSINFNQNIKTYAINDDENNVVKINTADIGIFARAEEEWERLEKFAQEAEQAKEVKDFNTYRKREQEIRNTINSIFNSDVCTPAFGKTYCTSPCNGEPLYIGLLTALLELVEEDITEENKKFEANVSKYTKQAQKLTK